MCIRDRTYAALGVFLFFFPRGLPWVETATTVFAWAIIVGQCRNALFYYPILGARAVDHAKYVAISGAFIALHFMGAYGVEMTVALLVVTSFRVSGTYVLRTVVKTSYKGFDWALVVGIVAIGTSLAVPSWGFMGFRAPEFFAAAVCLYAVVRNIGDLGAQMPVLKPASAEH